MLENNVIIYRYLQKCVENANKASYNKFIEGSKPLESVHTQNDKSYIIVKGC